MKLVLIALLSVLALSGCKEERAISVLSVTLTTNREPVYNKDPNTTSWDPVSGIGVTTAMGWDSSVQSFNHYIETNYVIGVKGVLTNLITAKMRGPIVTNTPATQADKYANWQTR